MPPSKKGRSGGWLVALGVVALGTLFAFYAVLQPRFSGGEGYPAYSTLRADPLGARALFDALQALPSVKCAKNFERLEKLQGGAGRTLVLLDLSPRHFNVPGTELDGAALARWAADGGRLVITTDPQETRRHLWEDDDDEDDAKEESDRKSSNKKPTESKKHKKDEDLKPKVLFKSPAQALKISVVPGIPESQGAPASKLIVANRVGLDDDGAPTWHGAARLNDDPAQDWDELGPQPIAKNSRSEKASSKVEDATEPSPWHTIATVRGHPVIMERDIGAGSVVVCTDSFFASNEALWSRPKSKFLAWIIGNAREVVFDETHLGSMIGDEDNVMTLARRYRMHGLFIGAFLLFGLYVWRNSSSLVPRDEARDLGHWRSDAVAGQSAASGLESLLVRGIPRKEMLQRCFETWDSTKAVSGPVPADRRAKAWAELASESEKRDVASKYRRLRDILHPPRR